MVILNQPLFAHNRRDVFGAQKGPSEIDSQHFVPVFASDLLDECRGSAGNELFYDRHLWAPSLAVFEGKMFIQEPEKLAAMDV